MFQGWVCPGFLVTAGPSESLALVEQAWAAHSLQPPDSCRILSVGLSHQCSLKPFKQVIILIIYDDFHKNIYA